MSRHIQWWLVFLLALLVAFAAASSIWMPFAEPIVGAPEVEEVFFCPENLEPAVCNELARINRTAPEEAELMIEALAGGQVPAPANEQSRDSITEGIDPNTVGSLTQTQVRVGQFEGVDLLRDAEGRTTLWEIVADGDITRVLRFDGNFETTPGVDLRVILSAHPSPTNLDEMNLGDLQVDVGGLKGNIGSQNYLIDTELDVTVYGSIVIYDAQLDAIWAVAPLEQPVQ